VDDNGTVQLDDFPGLRPVPPSPEVKRFEFSLEPKRFYVNDDLFEAAPALPLGVMSTISRFKNLAADGDGAAEKILEFMDMVLLDTSAQLLRERTTSKTRPVGIAQLMDIINFLLEEYGLRPTVPSASSSSGSTAVDGSTPSTDGASPAA
jgi:hypothetical protein